MKEKKKITVQIEEELWRKFSVKCAELGKKKGELLRALIEKWVRGEIDA